MFNYNDKVEILSKSVGKDWDQDKLDQKYPEGVGWVVEDNGKDSVKVGDCPHSTQGNWFSYDDLQLISDAEPIREKAVKQFNPYRAKVKPKTFMPKLNAYMNRLFSDSAKALYKSGLVDGDLLPTEKGIDELQALLFEEHNERLVERANEIIAENEKKKTN